MHRTLRRRAFGPALLITLGTGALLTAGCGAQAAASNTKGATGTGNPDAQVVDVRATEFGFTPTTIQVSVGKPVRLVLSNGGQIEHDLRVDKLPATGVKVSATAHGHGSDVAAHAEQGQQAWVEFTPTKTGTYDVSCTIAGHKEAGMKGKFLVV